MEFFLLLHLEILKIIYTKMNPALPATRKQKILRETKDYLMIALGMIMYGIDEYFPCEVHNHYTNVFNPLSVSINFSPKSEYDTSDMSDW